MNLKENLILLEDFKSKGNSSEADKLSLEIMKYFFVECTDLDECKLITKNKSIKAWMEDTSNNGHAQKNKINAVVLSILRFGEPELITKNWWLKNNSPWAKYFSNTSLIDIVSIPFLPSGSYSTLTSAIWLEVFRNDNEDYFKKWSDVITSGGFQAPQSLKFIDSLCKKGISAERILKFTKDVAKTDSGKGKFLCFCVVWDRLDILELLQGDNDFKDCLQSFKSPTSMLLTPSGCPVMETEKFPSWVVGSQIFKSRYPMIIDSVHQGYFPSERMVDWAINSFGFTQEIGELKYMNDFIKRSSPQSQKFLSSFINVLERSLLHKISGVGVNTSNKKRLTL